MARIVCMPGTHGTTASVREVVAESAVSTVSFMSVVVGVALPLPVKILFVGGFDFCMACTTAALTLRLTFFALPVHPTRRPRLSVRRSLMTAGTGVTLTFDSVTLKTGTVEETIEVDGVIVMRSLMIAGRSDEKTEENENIVRTPGIYEKFAYLGPNDYIDRIYID